MLHTSSLNKSKAIKEPEVLKYQLISLLPRRKLLKFEQSIADHLIFDLGLTTREYDRYLSKIEQQFNCELPGFTTGMTDSVDHLAHYLASKESC